MSTPAGASRRRKIAGERRPGRPAAPTGTPPEDEAADGPPTDSASTGTPPEGAVTTAPPGTPSAAPPAFPDPVPTARGASARGSSARGSSAQGDDRRGRGPAWWGTTPVVVALALLLFALVLAVALGATGHLGNQSVSEAHAAKAEAAAWDAGQDAPAAAERAATTILAYDYRSLGATEKEATQFMTPGYAKQYTQTFEKVVVPAAKQQKAKVTANVQASSVIRADPDKVKVLLYIDQTTNSAANQTPQVALNRVEMVMVHRGGSWLVDGITSY